MGFKMKAFDEAPREVKLLPSRGFQNVTLENVEAKRSSKGDPMMVWTQVIDTGEDAGHKLMKYFVFSDTMESRTWVELACICDAASFKWDGSGETLESLAFQFPTNGSFRYAIDVDYQYQIHCFTDTPKKWQATQRSPVKTGECPYEQWLDVTEDEYNEWEGKEGEDKRVSAGPRKGLDFALIYRAPLAESELGAPAMSGDGAADDNEPLPF